MKDIIKNILREEEREKHQSVSLDIDLDSGWKALQKQNEKKMKEWIDAIEWELLTQGLEIEEEEFEEPQVIHDLNALIKAIEEGKKDNYLMRTKNFKRLNLDKEKLAFWRNHLNKPEVQSVWAKAKGKIKNLLDVFKKDDVTVLKEHNVASTAKKYFIAAKLIANTWDDAKFDEWANLEDGTSEQWYRKEALSPMLKLLNLDLGATDTSEIFWLAYDNKEGLREGTFTSYTDLHERPLKTYKVSCLEQENESAEYAFSVQIDAYEKSDAWSDVLNNEDGEYHWYDWDGDADFHKEIYDSEMGARELTGIEEVGIEDDTSRKGALSEINEHIGASPVENDIISELEGLIENWDGCEEGLPIPCRYKNDVQSLIEKYKSKSLYEHTDNFTSHSDEPYIGEPIVNTNPGCTHYRSEGFIEDITDLPDDEGTTITYIVTNNGDTYKEGDTLTKTMDQLSPLVNEQYVRQINYPVVINEIYVHLMELFKKSLGDEKIKELVKTDVWNLYETEQYTKLFNINDAMQTKQIIQFMVDKGLPETYKEFLGENLPPIHNYTFSRTYEQNETAIYESSVSIEDTNYDSALCSADENWWEHDPEDEHVETTDTDYVGEEEWESVHVDGDEVWQARNFHTDGGKNDDRYDPHQKIC